MSSMWGTSPRWAEHVDFYVTDTDRLGSLADLRTLQRIARGKKGAILFGAVSVQHRYRDFVFALLLKYRRGGPPRVLITDATWQPGSDSLSRLTGLPASWFGLPIRLAIALIDGPHVRYAVLSTEELATFPRQWGVDPERVVFTPFPATIKADTPRRTGDYLFAGGNSLRDYDLLATALGEDGPPTVVAASWQPSRPVPGLRAGSVPHADFVSTMASCRAAVVPLRRTIRSAGQQSYLNAMLLEKPVIVTDAPGVRDYIEDGVTGIIVPPEPQALRAAIDRVMDPANAADNARMGAAARAWVLSHATQDIYKDEVLLDAIGLPRDTD
ncbi:MAG: glycosyltransferase [Mobilicoccus sp.]|nr:glycosyltransferase [Mobilicoccus sp.]